MLKTKGYMNVHPLSCDHNVAYRELIVDEESDVSMIYQTGVVGFKPVQGTIAAARCPLAYQPIPTAQQGELR